MIPKQAKQDRPQTQEKSSTLFQKNSLHHPTLQKPSTANQNEARQNLNASFSLSELDDDISPQKPFQFSNSSNQDRIKTLIDILNSKWFTDIIAHYNSGKSEAAAAFRPSLWNSSGYPRTEEFEIGEGECDRIRTE